MAVFLACYGVQPYLVSGSFFLPSYVSGPRRQWLGHFLRKGLMYVCHLLGALSPGGQACTSAWRDWISFQKCPPECSIEFPRMGKFRVTHVTMGGSETLRLCVPSPCLFGLPVYVSSDNWVGVVFSRCPLYTFRYLPMMSRATWTNRIRVVLHMLQVPVTQTAFPIATPRGRSVSFPTQGTMVTYITWDVLSAIELKHFFGKYRFV